MKFLATFIYRQILDSKSKILRKFYTRLRQVILRFSDPLITLKHDGVCLKMPFSHDLFIFQNMFKNYDKPIGQIAKFLRKKQGHLNMIDVGANIGDTAVFAGVADASFLLVEGQSKYNELIKHNIALNYGKNGGGGGE